MTDVLILIYVGLSLVLGGITATVEVWNQPTMLDRADGRGKFPSPRLRLNEGLLFGLFVTILWPYLLVAMIVDVISPKKDDDDDDEDDDDDDDDGEVDEAEDDVNEADEVASV